MNRSFLTAIIAAAIGATIPATFAAPQWIWLSKEAKAGENITLKTEFNVPGDVTSATLRLACDNGATAVINGKEALKNANWDQPAKADVKGLLQKGANTIVLNARNAEGIAAAVATLEIVSGGAKTIVETNGKWLAAPAGGSDFKPAVVIANHGDQPWGDALGASGAKPAARGGAVADPAALQLAKGFKAELIYTVPKPTQGSWVSLTVDGKGRLLAGDQGGGIFRITPPAPGSQEEATVENMKLQIAGAHGLLYAFNSLYAVVNEKGTRGLHRMREDGDGFGAPELLRKMDGGGEHGPHSVILTPDGKSLFFNGGNHTKLPENMELSRAAKAWSEDHILPRLWDGNGHAKGVLAPGGYICKTDADGKTIELYSAGFRNQFGIALNADGELFTFDADMEWDIGTPWYRPTRIDHCVSGGESGWRSGSGKWPDFYPDMLPPTLDIGPGSPTGVCSGTGAKFPAKYQQAIFALDWTYGTMYAIHFTPDGASYRAEKEEFVAGKPLPLTNAVISPKDGAMYFTIGGRGSQSALYRVTYVGTESTAPAPKPAPTAETTLRRTLEKLHDNGTGPDAIEKAWPYLAHKDRYVRFAARVAIERQPAKLWAARALAEKDPQAAIEALVALARVGRSEAAAATKTPSPYGSSSGPVHKGLPEDAALQNQIITALGALDFAKLGADQRLGLLRAWQLCFTRLGKPAADVCAQVAAKLDPLFPTKSAQENRELLQLLIFLDSPTVVAKAVPLLSTVKDVDEDIATASLLDRNTGYGSAAREMQKSRPNRHAIAFAAALRNATAGWTPELRRSYFTWFSGTRTWRGGNSFPRFMDNIRTEALGNFAPPTEKAELDALSKKAGTTPVAANVAPPKGPGRAYNVDTIVALVGTGLTGRDFAKGKAMYAATLCASCHPFAGEGGSIGPDLTGVGSRYTIRDLAENIVEPSKVISDQYGSELLTKKDGSIIVGRVIAGEAGKLTIMSSPLAPDVLTTVPASEVASRKPWDVSMMPPGLINTLNEEELKDLLAFMLSGGKPDDKVFKN